MGWWVWLWAALLAAWTLLASIDDYAEDGLPRSVRGTLSGASCVACLMAYFDATVAASLGRLLLPLAGFAAIEQTIDRYEDLRSTSGEQGLATFATAAVAIAFGAPIAMGIIRALEVR